MLADYVRETPSKYAAQVVTELPFAGRKAKERIIVQAAPIHCSFLIQSEEEGEKWWRP